MERWGDTILPLAYCSSMYLQNKLFKKEKYERLRWITTGEALKAKLWVDFKRGWTRRARRAGCIINQVSLFFWEDHGGISEGWNSWKLVPFLWFKKGIKFRCEWWKKERNLKQTIRIILDLSRNKWLFLFRLDCKNSNNHNNNNHTNNRNKNRKRIKINFWSK